MTNMAEDAHKPHKSSGTDTVESHDIDSIKDEIKVFPKRHPTVATSGSRLTTQVNFTANSRRSRKTLDQRTGRNSSSDNPHRLGRLNGSWTADNDHQDVGFFSTGVEYGSQDNSGNWMQNEAHILNLYDDIHRGSRVLQTTLGNRVEVHERSDGLLYENGNEYSWPAGWLTEQQREGTAIRIQASYVDLYETIRHAFEYLVVALGKARTKRYTRAIIHETVRFSGLELHHRHHLRTKDAAVQTLRDSARLVVSGNASGKEKAAVEAWPLPDILLLDDESRSDWVRHGHHLRPSDRGNADGFGLEALPEGVYAKLTQVLRHQRVSPSEAGGQAPGCVPRACVGRDG